VIGKWFGPAVGVVFAAMVVMSFLNYEIPAWLIWAWLGAFFIGAGVFTVTRGMTNFVIRRLLETVFAVWAVATLTFLLLRILPGGPFDSEKALPAEVMANLATKYHLSDPLLKQYFDYMVELLHGHLGQSYKYIGRDISSIMAESFPNSLQLGVYALLISYLIGLTLGVFAGWKRGTWVDFSAMTLAISGVSLPSFLMAPIAIMIFTFWLGWLEPALWEGPRYYIMPMIVLGIRPAAEIARLTRASVLEVIHSDYIRTARAKGLDARTILFKHVLRNSLIPVLSLAGPLIAAILTGSFVIEQIYAIPGIAKHLIGSVLNRDYPLILGTTLLFSIMLIVSNLIMDLLMAVMDPRVKMQ
jgi:oligopeptide transport system permease protein